jgi:hypothetical protein
MVAAFSVVYIQVHPDCMHVCVCPACSLSGRFYALRRSVASTLVALCSHSKQNQHTLINTHATAYDTLMAHVLPNCGDADTQVCCWACGHPLTVWGSVVDPRSIAPASRSCVLTGLQVTLACLGVRGATGGR